jgi:hypothetical protein
MANSGLSPEMAQAIDNYVTYHGSGCDDEETDESDLGESDEN